MAISDSQKVDYLFKKVGYSVAKTDTSTVKSPSNESISSPLVIRGGSIWTNSDNIPSAIPASNSSVVLLYKDSLTSTVQTTNDGTASANRTWLTNLTDWIDPSFGSTYQVKVYLDTAGNTAPQTTGTQLFADGTGSDEWFFDYASGVLNFIGTNLPSVSFTGKRIFVSGARYVGNKGLGNLGNTTISGTITANAFIQNGRAVLDTITSINVTGDVTGTGNVANIVLTLPNTGVTPGVYGSADDEFADHIPKITVDSKGRITNIANVTLTQVGNVNFNNTTISANSDITISSTGNVNLDAQGAGIVQVVGTDAFGLPSGETFDRPDNPEPGYIRYNLESQNIEFFNGNIWTGPEASVISSEIITPDGVSVTFAMSATSTTTNSVLVSINGTMQQPYTAYNINNDEITFTEIPAVTDIIEIRSLSSGGAVSASQLRSSGANIILSSGTITIAGDLIPFASNAYSVGSSNNKWKDLYLSGNVVHSGNTVTEPTSGQTVTVDSFSTSTYRTAKYILQATSGTEYQSSEILVTHNGTVAYNTVYGVINTGNILGNISTTVSGSNVLVQYTTSYNNTNIRIAKNYIVL